MPVNDLERLESKIDRVAAGATEVSMGFGGVQFKTMMELMEFAKLMAVSGAAVPVHLRGNPGACLAICTKAMRFGFDPFALAEHSFEMMKDVEVTIEQPTGGRVTKKEKVGTIAYDSYVIRAIIEAHAPIVGRLEYNFDGEGDARTCTVSAVLRETKKTVSHTSPTLGKRLKDIGVSDRGYIKGSPLWATKPDQQLGYDTARDLCRLNFPEVLMGWYDKDEFEEYAKAASATDITPGTGLKERLKGGGDGTRGFSHAHVENALAAPTDAPMQPITVSDGEPVVVGAEAPEQKPPRHRRKAADAPATMSEPLTRGFDVLKRTRVEDVPDLKIGRAHV